MKKNEKTSGMPQLIIAGAIIGAVNGFLGAGGGIAAVLTLTGICRFDEKCAHATAISVILPLSFVTAVIYAVNESIDYYVLVFAAPALLIGSIIGAKLIGKIPSIWLERIFALMMLASGVWMLL